MVGVQGSPLQIHGSTDTLIDFGEHSFKHQIIVADSLTTEAILGLDFLEAQKCMIDTGQSRLIFKELGISLPIQRQQKLETTGSATMCAFV